MPLLKVKTWFQNRRMKHKKVSKKSVNSSTSNSSTKFNSAGVGYDEVSVSSKTNRKRTDSETSGGNDDDSKTEHTSRSINKASDYDSMSSRSSSRSSRSSECNDEYEQFESDDLISQNSELNAENKKAETLAKENQFKMNNQQQQQQDEMIRRNLNLFQALPNQQQLNQLFNEIIKNRDPASIQQNLFLNEFLNFNQAFSMFKPNQLNENGK